MSTEPIIAVNRFGLGAAPGELAAAAADPRGWLIKQINGAAPPIPEFGKLAESGEGLKAYPRWIISLGKARRAMGEGSQGAGPTVEGTFSRAARPDHAGRGGRQACCGCCDADPLPGAPGLVLVEPLHGLGGKGARIRTRRQLREGGHPPACLRHLLSSLGADAKLQGEAIRSHWGIENSHHWVMDMLFRDDECRIRTANAPANFATIKHMAGNLLRHGAGKQSLRVKRRLAAWDDDYLVSLISAAV